MEDKNRTLMNKIWIDMKYTINFIRFKTTIDQVWYIIFLIFYKLACISNKK